LSSNFIETKT